MAKDESSFGHQRTPWGRARNEPKWAHEESGNGVIVNRKTRQRMIRTPKGWVMIRSK